MKCEQLQFLLDLYGSDLEKWPRAKSQSAEQLLLRSADARRLVSDAREFDQWLNNWHITDNATVDSVPLLGNAETHIQRPTTRIARGFDSIRRRHVRWLSVLAVGLSALLGTVAGFAELDCFVIFVDGEDIWMLLHPLNVMGL